MQMNTGLYEVPDLFQVILGSFSREVVKRKENGGKKKQ